LLGYKVCGVLKKIRDERLVIAFKPEVFELQGQEEVDFDDLASSRKEFLQNTIKHNFCA